jgi:hypothetical protein
LYHLIVRQQAWQKIIHSVVAAGLLESERIRLASRSAPSTVEREAAL